jgi:TonB family protein
MSPRPARPPVDPSLPPGLRVDPIRKAYAPSHRPLSLAICALMTAGLAEATLELSRCRPAPLVTGDIRTVGVELSSSTAFGPSEPSVAMGGGGGKGAQPLAEREPVRVLSYSSMVPDMDNLSLPMPTQPYEMLGESRVDPVLLQKPQPVPGTDGRGGNGGEGAGMAGGRGPGYGSGKGTWIRPSANAAAFWVNAQLVDMDRFVTPHYPAQAAARGISGLVTLDVTIDDKGTPIKWIVLEGQPDLAQATLDVLPQWHFNPVKWKGEKVNATFTITINFVLSLD